MFMVLLILDDPGNCKDVLDAWDEAGAYGVTILPSTGLGRVRGGAGLQDDLPLMPSLDEFFEQEEKHHRTLITIVKDQDTVDRIAQATMRVVGDLNEPNTGIMAVLPVAQVYGLQPRGKNRPS